MEIWVVVNTRFAAAAARSETVLDATADSHGALVNANTLSHLGPPWHINSLSDWSWSMLSVHSAAKTDPQQCSPA
eukprot:737290-Rhodomonas_salina.1